MDIKILDKEFKFKYRVSAIYIIDNKLLVNRYHNDSYCLPGGFVTMGENSKKAVIRELKEETGLDFEIIKCGGIIENFFTNIKNQKTHEITFYYFVKLCDNETLNKLDMDFVENEKNGNIKHQYSWIPLNDINNYNIFPNVIKYNLDIKKDLFHYIVNE